MFELRFTSEAVKDLSYFRKGEQSIIMDCIEADLVYEPMVKIRHRKPLRPNDLSAWELRIGKYRVFYDVNAEKDLVIVKAVGYKEHNNLFIRGRRFSL